jgi:(2R)-3-sulfolactate dehydrogenase (NADP+)
MVDVLAGVLTGSNCSYEASMFANTEGGPPNVGQTIIAMDPAFFGDGFVPHMETMFNALTEGNDVRIPGARRGAERVKHEAEGVEVPETLLEQIETLAAGG